MSADNSTPDAPLMLYFSPGACSRVTLIALEEAGAAYVTRPVGLARGENDAPAYRALNPKGKVPLLRTPHGLLSENVAILGYLAERHPEAGLLPAGDAWARAQALSVLAWCASGLHPLIFRARRPQRVCDLPEALPRVQALAKVELAQQLAIAETRLQAMAWLLGNAWSVADAYLFWIWGRAVDVGIEAREFPALTAHSACVLDRPATRRALARESATNPD